MINIRNILPMLYDYYLVATEMSFSAAAEKNFLSQSNLSRSVQNLENTLNLQLINRTNKGITLTKDGEELYNKVDRIFNNLKHYDFNSENDEVQGTLVIGTTRNISDYKLLNYISVFNKRYPKVKIKFLVDSASNLNNYLITHKIDVLIDYLPQINYSAKFSTEVKAITSFETCFACSKKFYDQCGKKISSIKELNNYNLVLPGNSRRRQLLDEVLQKLNIELVSNIEMPDSKLMGDFVNTNDYIGYFIKEEAEHYGLVEIKVKEVLPTNSIGMIYFENILSVTAKKFVDLVLELVND